MKLPILLAIISGLLLALFLWLRPVVGEIGNPSAPDVSGRAGNPVPNGTSHSGIAPPGFGTSGAALTTSRPSPGDAEKLGITNDGEIERLIFESVNQERAKKGLAPLQEDGTLHETARAHSSDMLARGYFAHEDPDGWSFADRIAERHRRMIGLTGENIWKVDNIDISDRKKVVQEIMDEWMHSPEHQANILSGAINEDDKLPHTYLGVGVSIKGQNMRVTQNFAAIRALIDQPVPRQIPRGERLKLAATPSAEKYDFFSPEKGDRVGDAKLISDGTVKVPAGTYKLRFYFPKEGRYVIYWGPRIEVK